MTTDRPDMRQRAQTKCFRPSLLIVALCAGEGCPVALSPRFGSGRLCTHHWQREQRDQRMGATALGGGGTR